MGQLRILLLGGLTIRVDDRVIAGFKSRKAEAILAYLAYRARPQTREHLAALFWEGSDPEQAAANLRKTLSDLRQQLGQFLLISRETVSLDPAQDWWLDAAAFQRFIEEPAAPSRRNLEQAIILYQGDFLAGFFLRDSLAFDEWASLERERLRLLALSALHQFVTDCLHSRRYDLGISQATRWLNLDPFNETAYRLIMRLHARRGQRNPALTQFATCQRVLAEELGVEPTAATVALAQRIRHSPQYPFHLPPTFTPFVGRGEELAHISRTLEVGRVVTITGAAGCGKTRLAAEAARIHSSDFAQGVYFVTPPDQATDWVITLSHTLGLSEIHTIPQLVMALRGREHLLIFDHLATRPDLLPLLAVLLQQIERLKFILISSQPTGLPGEQHLALSGLPYPPTDFRGDITRFPAVQLFVQQARRVRLHFTLTPDNRADVAHICQLVAGLPRDLELAAATVRAFTPRQIVAQLQENQAANPQANEYPRAARALWNDAWVLLDDAAQAQMAPLAPALPQATTQPQTPLVLHLLGGFQPFWQGQLVSGFKSRKAEALFAYLVCQSRPHARETLATMFWDESSQEQALANLRKLLAELPPIVADYLLITRQTVTFDSEQQYWLDAAAFQHLLAHDTDLVGAVALYQGDFLADFSLPDSPEFEGWAALERERLRYQLGYALRTIAQDYLHRRQYQDGLVYARRLQQSEPLSEMAHRLILLLLARQGQIAEALAYHKQFAGQLMAQLGIAPTGETQALVERIRSAAAHAVRLPSLPIHFVGRESELALLNHQLDDPACRLLTVTGPGGVGKTTLALVAAADRQFDYLHGVIFVSLVGINNVDELVSTLAAALGFTFSGPQPSRQQLLNFLRQKEMLLVLDNSETLTGADLIGSLDLIVEILQQARQVKILATSRDRFNIAAEQVCPLIGLPVPAQNASEDEIMANEAVQLFTLRAQKNRADFTLTPENAADVVMICRLVQGVPLGLELAAAAVAFYPVERIALEVGRNLDFLVHHTPEQVDRHRSLRAVFSYSWQWLDERERDLFRHLSLFRGRFSLEAAQIVAGATQQDILSLTDKTMVRLDAGEWYQVHELLRQYGAEKLADMPATAAAGQKRHAAYYAHLLQQYEPALFGRDIVTASQFLHEQMDNIRAAWRWAVAQKDTPTLAAAAIGLSRYCLVQGLFQEGERLFSAAAAALSSQPTYTSLCIQFLSEQARFLNEQALYDQAIEIAQKAIRLHETEHQSLVSHEPLAVSGKPSAHAMPNPKLTSTPHLELGRALWRQGEYAAAHEQAEQVLAWSKRAGLTFLEAEGLRLQAGIYVDQGLFDSARVLFEASLRLAQEANDLLSESSVLHNLGLVNRRAGDFATAQYYYKLALEARQATGYRQGAAMTLNNLGAIALDKGEYSEAALYNRQALTISRQIGDRYVESMALINLGIIAHDQGIYAAARTGYEDGLVLCREMGNRRLEGVVLNLYALLLNHLGEYAAALQAADQLLTLGESLNDQSLVGYAWLNRGHSRFGLREWELAQMGYERALLAVQDNLRIYQMEPLAGLAQVHLACGELVQARQTIQPVLDFLAEGHQLDGVYDLLQVYLSCYEVLQTVGEGERGRDLLTQAYTILQQRAAKISDEETRRSFLYNVTIHRQLAELYQGVRAEE